MNESIFSLWQRVSRKSATGNGDRPPPIPANELCWSLWRLCACHCHESAKHSVSIMLGAFYCWAERISGDRRILPLKKLSGAGMGWRVEGGWDHPFEEVISIINSSSSSSSSRSSQQRWASTFRCHGHWLWTTCRWQWHVLGQCSPTRSNVFFNWFSGNFGLVPFHATTVLCHPQFLCCICGCFFCDRINLIEQGPQLNCRQPSKSMQVFQQVMCKFFCFFNRCFCETTHHRNRFVNFFGHIVGILFRCLSAF